MSTRPLNGIRSAFIALAALAISVPVLRAQSAEQTLLNSILSPKTIVTATPAALAAAVQTAVTTNTNGFTAADLATAAFQPLSGAVRSDRNASAPVVVSAALAVLSSTSGGFDAQVASLVDSVVDVNNGTSGALSAAGQTSVVKAALGSLSDTAVASGTTALAADASIGAALEQDANITGAALTAIFDAGIVGINGSKGKSTSVGPQAAQEFVAGIVAGGTLPNVVGTPSGAAYASFAVSIIKPVSKNASVVELIANAVAVKDNASQADQVTLATALFAKYKTAQAKITQGIAAAIPATSGTSDAARVSFVGALTTAAVTDAVNINQGAVFVDPYKADLFTAGVFNSVLTVKGAVTLGGDAKKIATVVGQTLGQDGDELTNVAVVYQDFITAGNLPAASAVSYATGLINGAIAGLSVKVPTAYYTPALGDGGKLNGGKPTITTAITVATVNDMASIVDSLAIGILGVPGITSAKAASGIGALVKGVATVTKNEFFNSNTTAVAAFLAGSLATTVKGLTTGDLAEETAIDNAIDASLKSITSKTVFGDVTAAVASGAAGDGFAMVGPISVQETVVTNL